MASYRRLYKSSDSMIAGVCGGIAEYFNIDPTLVRILAVVLVIVGVGLPIILYLIGAVLIPEDPAVKSGYIDAKAGAVGAASSVPGTAGTAGAAGTASVPSAGGTADAVGAASAASSMPGAVGAAGAASSMPGAVGAASSMPGAAEKRSVVGSTMSNVGRVTRSHWSFAVVTGAFLICIGFLILLGNLVNVSFWRFWPCIFIIVGVIQLFTPSSKGWSLERAGGAIVMVAVGLVLLGWTLQAIVMQTFVLCLVNLWPMLLIVGGLYIISGAKKMSAFSLIGSMMLATTLLVGSWYYGATDGTVSVRLLNGKTVTFSVPASPAVSLLGDGESTEMWFLELGSTREANLQLRGGGMITKLTAGDGSEIIVNNLTNSAGGNVELGFIDSAGELIHLDLSRLSRSIVLNTRLPKTVVWNTIAIDVGTTDLTLDFTDLQVRNITIQTGVSSCNLRLDDPLRGGSRVDIHCGLAAVRIEIPRDSAVIIYTSGINALDIDQRNFTYNPVLDAWCSRPYTKVFGDRLTTDAKVWVISQSGVTSLEISVY